MSAPHEACRTARCVVLLVDDEPLLRRITARGLREADYDVLEADDGRSALAILRSGATVDIMLSDIMMPRMTGVELGHAVRAEFPAIPILLMSGYPGLEPVPFRFIAKPFQIPTLVAAITEVIKQRA